MTSGRTVRSFPRGRGSRTSRTLLATSTLAAALLVVPDIGSTAPVPVAAASASPEIDHAVLFDGVDDQADAATTIIPTTASTAFSVEAWLFDEEDSDSVYREAMSQGNGGTAFYLGTTANSQRLRVGDTWIATGVDLPVGRWVHVAVTTPGDGTAKLYLDGRHVATRPTGFSGPTGIGSDFRLGRQFIGDEFWKGGIDTVRVWSVERSGAEIVAAMHTAVDPSTAGLIAQYLANEGSGTTLTNHVTGASAATDLTLIGAPTWSPVATTTTVGSDTVVSFPRSVITSTGGWQVPERVGALDALLVAGGGGGGAWVGAGGGAGGMLESNGVAVTPGTTVAVTVGQGGGGAVKSSAGFVAGANGQNSTLGSGLTAVGGGVGASWTDQLAANGGSGGGTARPTPTQTVTSGTSGQGNPGGVAFSDTQPHPAGGGGGAGAVGQNGQSGTVSGAGGAGRISTITGASVTYAGGGGGSSHGSWTASTYNSSGTPGAGGTGGGGAGGAAVASTGTVRGDHGTAGLGGGGGGAANSCGSPCQTSIGGDGGSGVVIVRYTTLASLAVTTTPVAGAAGGRLVTQPAIELRDSVGGIISRDSASTVTVSASSGATLSGTTTVTAASGVATFTDLGLDAPEGLDVTLTFEVSSAPGVTVGATPIRVATPWRDDVTAGGGWVLVGYGANGILGGHLDAASGAYDPATRTGRATIGALESFRTGHEVAFAWNQTGFATGGLDSYDHAVSFVLPHPSAMTLTGVGTPSTAVTVTELVGTFGLAPVQYVEPLTLGAAYNGSYGFTNAAVDWGPDGQSRQAVYLDHAGSSPHAFPEAYTTINGTNTGYVPSTMAIWVRSVTESATALEILRPAVAGVSGAAFTTPPALRLANALGTTVSANNSLPVTVAVSAGATLSGTTTVTVSAGVATFTGLSLTGPDGPHTVTYSVPGLTSVTQTVTIAAVPAASVVVPTLPPPPPTTTTTTPTTTDPTTPPPSDPPATTPPPTVVADARPVSDEDGNLPDLEPGFITASEDATPVQVELSRLRDDIWQIAGSGFQLELAVGDGASGDAPIDRSVLTLSTGTSVQVDGSGFEPGGVVDVWMFSEPRLLGRLDVAASGDVSGVLTVPGDLAVGAHTLQVNGRTSDGRQRSVSVGVEVMTGTPTGPPGEVPGGGLPGTGAPLGPWLILGGLATFVGLALRGGNRRRSSRDVPTAR